MLAGYGRQPCGYSAPAREVQVGGDFCQGDEDKGTQVQPGVRQGQVGRIDDGLTVEQQVQVQGAGGVGDGADSALVLFFCQEGFKHLLGREARFQGRYRIDKVGLVRESHGGCQVQGGGSQ